MTQTYNQKVRYKDINIFLKHRASWKPSKTNTFIRQQSAKRQPLGG